MSTTIYWRDVHIIIYQNMSTNIYIGGLSTNYLCFENNFFIHDNCMCEGVGEDSRYGTGHVDIQVGICIILLECAWLPLHEHLGGE